ncbi:MAG: hypothetical protein PHD81_03515 [Candidatus Nanoarchaeia archaeon]|nr:hypothetical protein [Candidatus Nanoarchaeia archaeon]MDD5588152.1 hypothetical protein [Candidatus Nanoarchaeia archaeon]
MANQNEIDKQRTFIASLSEAYKKAKNGKQRELIMAQIQEA